MACKRSEKIIWHHGQLVDDHPSQVLIASEEDVSFPSFLPLRLDSVSGFLSIDESSIIFEPYNLDNSMAIFHDAPNAIHGVRRLTEDVQRKAVQICLEEYSEKDGWSGWSYSDVKKEELPEL